MQKIYKNKELEAILPHKPPMILIDRIIEFDYEQSYLKAEVDILDTKQFYNFEQKGIPSYIGIEYIAQSIAAFAGIYQTQYKKEKTKIGFIIGTREYECFISIFPENSTLSIEVKQLFLDFELACFDCKISSGNKELVKTQLNVFQPLSIENFINNNVAK